VKAGAGRDAGRKDVDLDRAQRASGNCVAAVPIQLPGAMCAKSDLTTYCTRTFGASAILLVPTGVVTVRVPDA